MRAAALQGEVEAHIAATWKQAVAFGTLPEAPRIDPVTMFDDVFRERTPHLEHQRRQFLALKG